MSDLLCSYTSGLSPLTFYTLSGFGDCVKYTLNFNYAAHTHLHIPMLSFNQNKAYKYLSCR